MTDMDVMALNVGRDRWRQLQVEEEEAKKAQRAKVCGGLLGVFIGIAVLAMLAARVHQREEERAEERRKALRHLDPRLRKVIEQMVAQGKRSMSVEKTTSHVCSGQRIVVDDSQRITIRREP